MLAGRELVAQPEADHGVDPVQRPAVGDADGFAAIELGEAGIGEADGAREIQIDLVGHVPETAAGIGVERREGLIAARPFRDLEQAGGLDDRHREGVGGVGLEAELDARDWIGIGGARCGDGELCPDDIGKEAEAALVGLEITHEPHQRIALLEEIDDAGIDVDGIAACRRAAVQVDRPAVGRGREPPVVGRLAVAGPGVLLGVSSAGAGVCSNSTRRR